MNKKEIKEKAQGELLHGMQVAFSLIDEYGVPENEVKALQTEMSRQMARVEKLFGFVPFSFTRGC